MDEQFPPNTHRMKEADKAPKQPDQEPKKVSQVTAGKAKRKKSSLGARFTQTFIGGDAKTAAGYVVATVIVPTIQELLAEGASTLIERMIYGDRRRGVGRRPGPGGGLGHVAYDKMASVSATRPAAVGPPTVSNRSRARHDFTEIVISSRSEADEVLDQMYNLLERYDEVTVSDLYALTGIRSSHTDQKWGWNNLRGASVGRIRGGGGYVLELPEPIELK